MLADSSYRSHSIRTRALLADSSYRSHSIMPKSKQTDGRAKSYQGDLDALTETLALHIRKPGAIQYAEMLMFEEYPLPQIPKDTPSLGWKHSRVACAVLEFQSGNAILAQVQGIRPDLSGESAQQIENISPVVCTQQTLKSSYHCYIKFPPKVGELDQVVAHCCSSSLASISEEVLGSVRTLPTDSYRCG